MSALGARRFAVLLLVAMFAQFLPFGPFRAEPAQAQSPTLTITPTTWDVIGLDSNRPAPKPGSIAPGTFPVGGRVCNTSSVDATSVFTTWSWGTATKPAGGQGADPFSLTTTSRTSQDLGALKAGQCKETVYNVSVTQSKNSFFWKKLYTINVRTNSATGAVVASTPSDRALYVEKLVSQNRNATISISSDAPTDGSGGYQVYKGQTYRFVLNAKSAPGGYEQTEAFISFPDGVFEIQSIKSFYSTPTGGTADGIYGDACGWDASSTSVTWRTCIGPAKYSGGKAGGNPIKVVYWAKAIGTGTGKLSALIYDLSGSSYHYNGDFNSAGKTFTASTAADLSLTKSDSGAFVRGLSGQYTLTVTNKGPDPTSGNVTIVDTLPSGLTYASVDAASTSGWSCSASGQTVTCNNSTVMNSGSTSTLKLNVNVSGSATKGAISNTATVSNPVADPVTSNNTATDAGTIADPGEADLSIAKSHSAAYFPLGTSNNTYTIDVKNEGPADIINGIRVTDTLPAGLSYGAGSGSNATHQWSCSASGQTVTCDLQTSLGIAAGLTAGTPAPPLTLTVAASGSSATKVTNSASVSVLGAGNPTDPNTSNNSASDPTFLGAADLEITKSHVGDFPIPPPTPAQGTFTISVKNTGPNNAPGPITVTDTLPSDLTFSSASGTGWSCSNSAQTVTCTRSSDLGSGETAPSIGIVTDVSASVTVDSTTNRATRTNTASVAAPSTVYDPDPTDNSSDDVVALVKQQDIGITVTDSPDPVTAGNQLTYALNVTNLNTDSTGVTATGVFWDMDLPAGTTFVSVDPDGSGTAFAALSETDLESTNTTYPCSYSSTGNFLTCSLNTTTSALASGLSQGATVVVSTSSSTPTSISANAEVFMDQMDGRISNNSATESTSVTNGNSPPTVTVSTTTPVAESSTAERTVTWTAWDNSGTISSVTTSCGLSGSKVSGSDTTPTGSGTQSSPRTATYKCKFDDGPSTSNVTVTASDGSTTGSASQSVTINNAPPTATLSAPSSVNKSATFTVSLGSPGDASAADTTAGFTYDFDCGSGYDGTFGSTASASCTAPSSGSSITVKGTIKDKDGGTSEYTATVTINNQPPTATVTLDKTNPPTNDTVTATATKTDPDGDTVTLTYVWKVTKGDSTCTLKTTSGSSSLTDTLNLGSSFTLSSCTGTALTTGASYSPSKGDVVTIEVTPNDGTVNGTTVSATATVANTAPTATNQSISVPHRSADPTTITLTGADADNDTLTYRLTSLPSIGTLYDGGVAITSASTGAPHIPTGTLTYKPGTDEKDPATDTSFTFISHDGTGTSASATVSIDLTNSAPSISAATLTPSSPTTSAIVTAGVTDPNDADGDTISYTYVWKLTRGSTTCTLDASASTLNLGNSYTVSACTGGSDLISGSSVSPSKGDGVAVTIAPSDGHTTGMARTTSVTVGNTAPVPTSQTGTNKVSLTEDSSVLITLAGTDADPNDSLTFKIVSLPSNGKLYKGSSTAATDEITDVSSPVALSGTTVTFVPTANYNNGAAAYGPSFTFSANDGTSDSTGTATVEIDVNPDNDAPTWDASVSMGASSTLDLKTVSADQETADANLIYQIVTNGTKGTASLSGTTLSYTRNANQTGTDTVTVRVTDRGDPDNCGAVVTGACTAVKTTDKAITINLSNTAPVPRPKTDPPGGPDDPATDDVVTVTEDSSVLITLSATDAEGDAITYLVTSLPSNGKLYRGNSTASGDEITAATDASPVTLTGTTATFVPTANYNNGATAYGPVFTFKASDGSLTSNNADVHIDVNPDNDAPTWDTSVSMGASSTLDLKTVSADQETADANLTYQIVTNGTKGTASLSGATLSYTRNANQTGTDTVTVRVTDRGDPDNCGAVVTGACTAAKTTDKAITINLSNTAPVPRPKTGDGTHDTATTDARVNLNEDGSTTITLNATDAEGHAITYLVTSLPSNGKLYKGSTTTDEITAATDAAPVVLSGNTVTFVPTANYHNGSNAYGPTFNFKARDSENLTSNNAAVHIDVDPVNDAPTWDADVSMAAGGSLNLTTVSADLETADANLTYSLVGTRGGATKGTPTLTGSTLTYTRDANVTGTDTVTIRVTDRGDPDNCGAVVTGACTATKEVTKSITIALGNSRPTAGVTLYTQPNTGEAEALSSTQAPKTNDKVRAAFTCNDVDGDAVTLSIVWKVRRLDNSVASVKTTTISAGSCTGTYTDTLNLALSGNGDKGETVSVEVTPSDTGGNGNTASGSTTVVVSDTPPTATDRVVKSTMDTPKTLVLEGSDVDGDDVVFEITQQPATGSLVVAAASTKSCFLAAGTVPGTKTCHLNATYTPLLGATGSVTFKYKVTNSDAGSKIATVTIQIEATTSTGSQQTDDAVQDTVQGALVSTGTTPTSSDPVETMIIAARTGRIEIVEEPVAGTSPSGYSLFGQQIRITVLDSNNNPVTTNSDEPMRFTFLLDPSIIPSGNSASNVSVYRNGETLSACTGGSDVVQPTPACVQSRSINARNFLEVKVLTTAASTWKFAVPVATTGGGGGGGGGGIQPSPTPTPTPTPSPSPSLSPSPLCGEPIRARASDGPVVGTPCSELIIVEGDGDKEIDALAGDDIIIVTGSGAATIVAGDGDDVVVCGPDNDVVWGGRGDDIIDCKAGDDTVYGQSGNDTIYGNSGSDDILGHEGRDRLIGDSRPAEPLPGIPTEFLYLFDDEGELVAGDDLIKGGPGRDVIEGDNGDDDLRGGDDADTIAGGDGDDDIVGNPGNDVIHGGLGDDLIRGQAGNDKLYGNDGRDRIKGAAGDDYIHGGDGDDNLQGGDGDDQIQGAKGNDRVKGDEGDDRLQSGAGDDVILGAPGDDYMRGNEGDDVIKGGKGDDVLIGMPGNDRLFPGAGRNKIKGGRGVDTCLPGRGQNTYLSCEKRSRGPAGDGASSGGATTASEATGPSSEPEPEPSTEPEGQPVPQASPSATAPTPQPSPSGG